ncbi:RagB/SusD family nutrient uptake outer membrane protein [Daejeonella sp. JGW-45]|uniref:RagB/SusD family nutrient uptake outer membrane protein n=1 Tax=Daejeonella sp. JGW-45 TaxID=3034148 RepID=UPI0023ECE3C8|nr:RagB/SusD family nutrient uptake outer membrane protein [Daejeonella sp. JGW-45]
MKIFNRIRIVSAGILISIVSLSGCQKDLLDQQPLTDLSEGAFWNSEGDALLALTGMYNGSSVGTGNNNGNELLILSSMTDDSDYKNSKVGLIYSGYVVSSDAQVAGSIWTRGYRTIFKANYFLANIDKVTMDATKKAQLIAEAKFLRAYEYWQLAMFYGGVPLIKQVLTVDESKTQVRATLAEVSDFAKAELTAAAKDLPATRPASEKGRILKAAALAVKGRLELMEKKWADAAKTYKEIIDLKVHIIDPRYKAIFEERGEDTKETILSTNFIAGLFGNTKAQRNYLPDAYGGYQETNVYEELISSYLMKDGLPIETSPLYDPAKPFENRDPRLYATVFLPGYTVFNGKLFTRANSAIGTLVGATGYGWKKYATEGYLGDMGSSGDDVIHIRYAEVLLSYLEAKLENNEAITQELLDETINKVRGRAEVAMPAVTELDRAKLREIVRLERRIEFALEKDIRYMDIRRWGIWFTVMEQQFHGMKLTDTPETFTGASVELTGKYRGHLKTINKKGTHKPGWALLPIPLTETQLNPKLIQNPDH